MAPEIDLGVKNGDGNKANFLNYLNFSKNSFIKFSEFIADPVYLSLAIINMTLANGPIFHI